MNGMLRFFGRFAMEHQMSMPRAVKLFILRTNLMKKAIIQVGYSQYVMDTQKALTLLELLAEAEVYEAKWKKDCDTMHHIYPQESHRMVSEFKVIPTAFYHMAKMAGKPEKES